MRATHPKRVTVADIASPGNKVLCQVLNKVLVAQDVLAEVFHILLSAAAPGSAPMHVIYEIERQKGHTWCSAE